MEIWDEPQYEDKQAELLNLMKNPKFKICYEHKDGYYLAPQLFDDSPADYRWNKKKDDLLFSLEYKFMPKGILSQLIVLLHKYIYENTYWKHGVILHYKSSRALVKEDRFNNGNAISVMIEGRSKRELFTLIHSNLDEINRTYTNLDITQKYACVCLSCCESDPYLWSSEVIERALRKSRTTVECHKSFSPVNINRLLGSYLKQDQIVEVKSKSKDIHRILVNTEEMKKKQKDILSSLEDSFQYLIANQKNGISEAEIEEVIQSITESQSEKLLHNIGNYIEDALIVLDQSIDEKIEKIYQRMQDQPSWETKIKIGIPLVSILGLGIESEFNLREVINRLTK